MYCKLLNLEGISGTGKTFYFEKLKSQFKNNKNIIFTREIFDEIHEGLNQKIFSALYHTEDRFFNMGVPLTETMLLLAKLMYKYESIIKIALDEGKIVVEDRGIDTVAMYQAILISRKNGEDPLNIAEEIYKFARKFIDFPKKTFLLYGDIETSIKRAEKRDGKLYKAEEIELLKNAEELYLQYSEFSIDRFTNLNIKNLTFDIILQKICSEILM